MNTTIQTYIAELEENGVYLTSEQLDKYSQVISRILSEADEHYNKLELKVDDRTCSADMLRKKSKKRSYASKVEGNFSKRY